MTRSLTLLFAVLSLLAWGADDDRDPYWLFVHPSQVERCLKLPVAADVGVTFDINPYYLRGDFDGDGKVDYAVAIKRKQTDRLGVLVCSGNGNARLLGAGAQSAPLFSDMPNDVFVAGNWAVLSRAEAVRAAKLSKRADILPSLRGDVIAMISEERTSLIYWDGKQFRGIY